MPIAMPTTKVPLSSEGIASAERRDMSARIFLSFAGSVESST